MGWIESFKICMFKKIFKFSGRASRQEFWKFWVICLIIPIIFEKIFTSLDMTNSYINIFMCILRIIIFIPIVSATVRRLHDIGKSAKLICIFFIPYATGFLNYFIVLNFSTSFDNNMKNFFETYLIFDLLISLGIIIYEICLLAKKGDPEINKYGEPPILNKTNETRN